MSDCEERELGGIWHQLSLVAPAVKFEGSETSVETLPHFFKTLHHDGRR